MKYDMYIWLLVNLCSVYAGLNWAKFICYNIYPDITPYMHDCMHVVQMHAMNMFMNDSPYTHKKNWKMMHTDSIIMIFMLHGNNHK